MLPNPAFGKFYNYTIKELEELSVGIHYLKIEKLINALFNDLIKELNKLLVSKRKIYDLLSALHNLPRVYLGVNKETLLNLNQESITENDALRYAFDNMDKHIQKKYKNFFD